MTPISLHSAVVRRAVRMACDGPGVEAREVAQALGLSLHYCRQALMLARDAGLVGVVWVRPNVAHWMAPEAAQELQRRLDVIRRQRRRKNWREQWARRNGRTAKPLADVPVHRVNAAGPLPFVVKAPRSVFELGAA